MEGRSTLSDFKSVAKTAKSELLQAFEACMQQEFNDQIDLNFKVLVEALMGNLKSIKRGEKGALDPTLEEEFDRCVPSLVMDTFKYLYQKVFKKHMVEMGYKSEVKILSSFCLAIAEVGADAVQNSSEADFCNERSNQFPISYLEKKYKLIDDFRQIFLIPLKQCVESRGGFSRLKGIVETGMPKLCDDIKAIMGDPYTKILLSQL